MILISGVYECANSRSLRFFAAHQGLAHRGQLDVDVVLGQVEIGPEHLNGRTIAPLERELVRLVLPVEA